MTTTDHAIIRHVAGPGSGREAGVDATAPLTVGRDAACGLRLDGATISRLHARFSVENGVLQVERISSGNQLWVNGAQAERADLRLWDLVVIGQHVLRVESLASSSVLESAGSDHDASLLSCLFEVQRLLASEEDSVVERALHVLLPALPATRLALFLRDADGVVSQGPTAVRGDADPLMSANFARQVLAAGRGLRLDDASGGRADLTRTMREQSVRSILGVPVIGHQGPRGALLCDNREEPGLLGEEHLRILASFARSIDHVMQRDELRLLEQERLRAAGEIAAARQVQEFLSAGVGASGRCGSWAVAHQPARDLAGDVVAVHEDAGGITWLVADVSGKGLSAALVAAMIKAAASRRLADGEAPPTLLAGLHRDLKGALPPGVFFTACALRLRDDGSFLACGVGHPPMLVLRADGGIERLASVPGMLGFFLPKMAERSGVLAPGDGIALLTDGATEAMDETDAMLGEEGIEHALSGAGVAAGPEALLAAVDRTIADHRGGREPSDDVTLVIGRFAPAPTAR